MFLAINSGDCVVFILCDLNDGFDTIDHEVLLDQTFCASLWSLCSFLVWSSTGLSFRLPPLFFYQLQLGSTVRTYCISLHCYVDDTKIFVPPKSNEAFSSRLLLRCLGDIMALNVFNFNEEKTEVMVFGRTTRTLFVELCSFVQYIKPTITNLWVEVDAEIWQSNQGRGKIEPFPVEALGQHKAFSAALWDSNPHLCYSLLDYCNTLYVEVIDSSITTVGTGQSLRSFHMQKFEYVSPILASLHWLPMN